PAVVVMAVAAHEIMLAALGVQWTAAAPRFRRLAIAGFGPLEPTPTRWRFTGRARGRAYAGWAVVKGTVTIAGFVVGVRWGVEGVAASYAVTQVVLLVPGFAVACRDTALSAADPFRAMARPVVVSLVVLAAAAGGRAAVVG